MVNTEDYKMGAIEVNIMVATEGDNSAEFYSLLIAEELSRGLRRGSAAAGCWDCGFDSRRWMNVSCKHCVSSGRGVCTGLINRPEESN